MTLHRPLAQLLLAGLTALATLSPLATHAQDTKIKMVLNWKYEGPQAWFFIAQDKGYFKAEGLDVEIDQGSGSAASMGQALGAAMGGALLAGFGAQAIPLGMMGVALVGALLFHLAAKKLV